MRSHPEYSRNINHLQFNFVIQLKILLKLFLKVIYKEYFKNKPLYFDTDLPEIERDILYQRFNIKLLKTVFGA